jgi:cation/acetate symporter
MVLNHAMFRRAFELSGHGMWWDIQPISAGVFGVPAGLAATVLFSLITQRKAEET